MTKDYLRTRFLLLAIAGICGCTSFRPHSDFWKDGSAGATGAAGMAGAGSAGGAGGSAGTGSPAGAGGATAGSSGTSGVSGQPGSMGGQAGRGDGGIDYDGAAVTDGSAGTVSVSVGSQTVFARRNGQQTITVNVTRDGVVGDVNITVLGLPIGVTVDPLKINAGASSASLTIRASATAVQGEAFANVQASIGVAQGGTSFRILVGGAPGSLDESFAGDGTFVSTVPGMNLIGRGLFVDANGILVTGATATQAITARLRPNGTFDTSFGGAGFVSTGSGTFSEGIGLLTLGDGRIFVAGVGNGTAEGYDFGLFGYKSNGALDPAFGSSGVVTFDPGAGYGELHAITATTAGQVVVAGVLFGSTGTNRTRALRYSSSGSRDPSFDIDEPDVVVESLALQKSDQKLVLAGFNAVGNFWLARYDTGGTRDGGFGNAGVVETSFPPDRASAHGLAILSDGRLLAAGVGGGSSSRRILLARYNLNGSLDLSFGTGGKLATSTSFDTYSPNAAIVDDSGRILIVGFANGLPAVARFQSDGAIDSSFGTNGIAAVDFGVNGKTGSSGGYGIALDSDGRVLFTGEVGSSGAQQMAVARLWP